MKENGKYFSVLTVGVHINKNMVVFVARSWSCGPRNARPREQQLHILLLHT